MSVLDLHPSRKPILAITKDAVAKRHMAIAEAHGEAYANLSMRLLRALFNFAAGQYEDSQGRSLISENPVRRLSQTRAWYRVARRQTVIKPHELARWYQAVMALENDTVRDYLLLVLFTGLRRQEAAKLTWDDIQGRTLAMPSKDFADYAAPIMVCQFYEEYVTSGYSDKWLTEQVDKQTKWKGIVPILQNAKAAERLRAETQDNQNASAALLIGLTAAAAGAAAATPVYYPVPVVPYYNPPIHCTSNTYYGTTSTNCY